ncbi:hypothetical protein CEXT_290171 [Caerostris extrusa]|uniref:Uncharacterized protein n=1 Tax=Caerostris extrusa TaxID=172846 RepID=A0AAV4NSQ3_CAEEX|nr:hypothetical protein CEXT_290171 [Caerostris extrusa]
MYNTEPATLHPHLPTIYLRESLSTKYHTCKNSFKCYPLLLLPYFTRSSRKHKNLQKIISKTRTNVYIISVMTATFNRSSGQTCSELQLVHVGKCFWPLLKRRHLMCPLQVYYWCSGRLKVVVKP